MRGNEVLNETDKCKVVEAHLHNDKIDGDPERVTIIYKGIGSLTFHLKPSNSMEQLAKWEGSCGNKNILCDIQFTNFGTKIEGKGIIQEDES